MSLVEFPGDSFGANSGSLDGAQPDDASAPASDVLQSALHPPNPLPPPADTLGRIDRMQVLTRFARKHVNAKFMKRALATIGLVPDDAIPRREAEEAGAEFAGQGGKVIDTYRGHVHGNVNGNGHSRTSDGGETPSAPTPLEGAAPKFRFARGGNKYEYPSGEKWPDKYSPPGKPDPGGVQNPGEFSTASGIQGVWKCFDLPKKMCKMCPHPEMNNAGNYGGCDLLQSQCVNL